MTAKDKKSNCCQGVTVDFYFPSCADTSEEDHIEAAVEALFEAIRKPGTHAWHPRHKIQVKAEFRDRLQTATRGQLRPVDHLKAVGDGRCDLFEIRWQDVGVAILGQDGQVSGNDHVHVRLIHTEPIELGMSFVGLHAHEKVVDGERTGDLQDEQIAIAEDIFTAGYPQLWGISRR